MIYIVVLPHKHTAGLMFLLIYLLPMWLGKSFVQLYQAVWLITIECDPIQVITGMALDFSVYQGSACWHVITAPPPSAISIISTRGNSDPHSQPRSILNVKIQVAVKWQYITRVCDNVITAKAIHAAVLGYTMLLHTCVLLWLYQSLVRERGVAMSGVQSVPSQPTVGWNCVWLIRQLHL